MNEINYLENEKNSKIKRVILFGVDGFASFLFKKDKSLFSEIFKKSQYTLNCRADYPTVSCAGWNCILTGTSVAAHGYTQWFSPYPEIIPSLKNEYDRYPTIFYNIKKTDENLKTAAFFTWTALSDILESDIIDKRVKNDTLVASDARVEEIDMAGLKLALDHFIKEKPVFMFMHNDNLDHMGHENQFESEAYVKTAKKIENNLSFLLEELKKANLEDETLVVLATDHGGYYRTHDMVKNMNYKGNMSKEQVRELTYTSAVVPLVFINPNLKNMGEIKGVVNNWDITPTISKILGIKLPTDAIGKPLKEVEFI